MLTSLILDDHDNCDKVQELIISESCSPELLKRLLWAACRRGKFKTAKLLLERGADVHYVNHYRKTVLIATASFGYAPDETRLKLAKLLIDYAADPLAEDVSQKNALFHAVEYNRPLLAEWLARFFDADMVSRSFYFSVQLNNCVIAAKLLRLGADIEFDNMNGTRPLIVAACKQYYEMISMLVNYGANINAPVGTGATALHFAAKKSSKILGLLLQKGCNVHARTRNQNTALHYAVENGRYDNVLTLLQNGAEPNSVNDIGETPLLLACREMHAPIVELLLQYKADPNMHDEHFSYPINQLVIHPNFDNFVLLDLLLRHGAHLNQETGAHPLALFASMNPTVSYEMIQGLVERGAFLPLSGWYGYVTNTSTLLELGSWALTCKKAAVAYHATFVYGEEKGVRPVPVPRRLTGAYGLYPIRRRLAEYMVYRKPSVRYVIQELIDEF